MSVSPAMNTESFQDGTKGNSSSDEEAQLLHRGFQGSFVHGRGIKISLVFGIVGLFAVLVGCKVLAEKQFPKTNNLGDLISEVAEDIKCPGSPARMHAGMKLSTLAHAACCDVKAEANARVDGLAGWKDPHNQGTYKHISDGLNTMSFSRRTGDDKFTDKMLFTLTEVGGSKCKIDACSESQGSSGGDFSTNYCNMKMLFCGSDDKCHPVIHDFTSSGETTAKIAQASATLKDCFNGPQIGDYQ